MKMNKAKFLKTEFGAELDNCIKCWDKWIIEEDHKSALWCQAQWEVYKMAIKQFYGIEYHFTRTDNYFGLVTESETDWLMKIDRIL